MSRKARCNLVGVFVVVCLLLSAGTASAVLVQLPNGNVVSYQPLRGAAPSVPFDTAFNNVDYNGGPVMPSNTDYLIFWSPKGYSAYGPGTTPQYVSGLETYFTDLAHDSGGHQNTDSVSAQYNDLTGAFASYKVTFGGAFLDTQAYPANKCPTGSGVTNCLDDAELQAELHRFVASKNLRHDLTHEYFLLTPPGVEGCFTSNTASGCSAGSLVNPVYCAYHGQTTSPMLFYSNDPYVTGNAGCDDGHHPNGPSDGALEGGLSHEQNESVTDPIPNDAWTNGAGPNHGQEIGDQCDTAAGPLFGPPLGTHNGSPYNQVINGHFYWYQEEWSNNGHTCLQRYTPPSTLPTAKFTATAGTGLAMNFNATGSSSPADFSWQFNDVNGASTVEQPTPTISHTFPATGAYSIGLAVFSVNGLSRGAGGIITTGHSGFTPGFTFSPSSPTVGQTVTFTGLTNVSRQPVTNYLWDFGDGHTGSGAKPTHAYAAAGTYHVKVVLFSGVGSAFPGGGAAPVYVHNVVVK